MLNFSSIGKRRRRASDGAKAPAVPMRDWTLEAAIAHEQVEVLFQPLIEPHSGRVAGAEALARCPIAKNATDLFDRARRAGLGERLSRLVQRKALRSAATWEGPLKSLRLSLNLLPHELVRPGFDSWLLEEVAIAGIAPERLTVEITEDALLTGQTAVAARLERLRKAGMRVALDDFGTGYASLAYLTTLPLDMIKIDRGLVTDLVGGARDRIVVKAMIRLARELDLQVIVEGVENIGQLDLLAEWGCDLYQGFFGAGALTQIELADYVASAEARAAA